MSESIKNYYQGIFITETILGNPNGDFIDNSPRNIDGNIFTTDKCIKYNIRNYLYQNYEKLDEKEDIVFFYSRLNEEGNVNTKDTIYHELFENNFEDLKNNSVDVRMFGGTFSFTEASSNQIYGPIQISYGTDINNAQIKKLQLGTPFSTSDEKSQTTLATESVVDDAIITYDIIINPNNFPDLLKSSDLDKFKEAIWYGTNLRKSTSKKTDAKLLLLIKFKNERDDNKVKSFNIGELKNLISIKNKNKKTNEKIEFETNLLSKKLEKYVNFIDSIEIFKDNDEVDFKLESSKLSKLTTEKLPNDLL